MTRRSVLPLLLGIVAATHTATAPPPGSTQDLARNAPDRESALAYAPGELVVQFRASATPEGRQAVREALGATRFRKLGRTRVESAHIIGLTVEEAIAQFQDHPLIEWIEPDYRYSTQLQPNDPSYPALWGLSNTGQTGGLAGADISAPRLWDQIHSAADVVIAIVDTGVDIRHEDLRDNIFVNPGEIAGNGIDDDGNGFIDDVHGWDFANNDNDPDDDNGHGTHVAGIAGAVGNNGLGTVGVAWNVRLMPLKFLDAGGFGTTSDAVAAIDYALSLGVKIINASWGGNSFSNVLRQAVQRTEAQGALFVAAAGNSTPGRNNEVFPFYPSSFALPNVIAVAATDHEDKLAGFSHFGAVSVDLAAPGVDILSTRQGDAYGFLSGTSMATPHVSGALALYKSRFPEIGMAEAKALVLDNVDIVDSLAGKVLTGGRLNAFRPVADPDDTAPGDIQDLQTVDPNATRIDLQWTATGDDGPVGTATRFDVRYATVGIDADNFDQATAAKNPPPPGPSGTLMRARIGGLQPDSTYYFALKALDEFGNVGPISNVAVGTTLGPPSVTITPAGVEADLLTGQRASRELRIANGGEGEYVFEIIVRHLSDPPGSSGPSRMPGEAAGAAPAPSGLLEVDSVALGNWLPATNTAAGNFEATDETAANGSRYSMHGFDATSGHFTGVYRELGNVRPRYAGLYVRSASVSTADAYFVLRDDNGAEAIFFFADNTGKLFANADVGGNNDIPYVPHRWYHVEFKNIDFESRTFDYHVDGTPIQQAIPFRDPFVENVHRVDVYNFHGSSEAWWDEMLISTEEPPSPVGVDRSTGIVPGGEQRIVTVEFNAAGLNGGDYRADVLVIGSDPVSPQITIPALLHVTGAPDIEVAGDTLDFGALFVGGTTAATLTVANRGSDTLTVTALAVDQPDFTVDPAGFSLGPNETRDVGLTFSPSRLGPISGTLTLTSNDPDQTQRTVTLVGNGLLPPAIVATPLSFEQELFTGERADQTLRVENAGFSVLEWEVAFPDSTDPSLEEVRQQIDGLHTSITGLIPNAFAFLGGEGSFSITDGGEDMYDTGNFISTNLESLIPYSNNAVRLSPAFGPQGRYFTRKYPKLFLFAADMEGVNAFAITGNLGADNAGQVDGTVLHGLANGIPHLGFVKRAFGAASPSVNHMIVVAERPGITHEFSASTNSDFHVVTGLQGSSRLYYLLYASSSGGYVDHLTTRAIFETFLRSLDYSNAFLDIAPIAGRLAGGASGETTIAFNATGLASGVYTTDLSIVSNDPLQPVLPVTANLIVTGAPDITLSESTLDFGKILIGDTRQRTLVLRNDGAKRLYIDDIVSGDPAFLFAAPAFAVDPGDEVRIELVFMPAEAGVVTTTLAITSDDPDEGTADVTLIGEGLAPPRITLSEDSLLVEQPAGEVAERSVTVGNAAGSDLVFTVRIEATGQGVFASAEEQVSEIVSPRLTGEELDPPPVGPDPSSSPPGAGVPSDPVDFTFRDDFEDGNLDGWLGGGFVLQAGEHLQPDGAVMASAQSPLPTAEAAQAQRMPVAAPPQPPTPTPQATVQAAAAAPFRAEPPGQRLVEGEAVDIVVTFDATDLNDGFYGANMIIASNDPAQREAIVALAMTVIGAPELISNREALDFGVVHLGFPRSLSFTLTNFGRAVLQIHDIVVDDAEFAVNSTAFDLAPGESRGVGVTFAPEVVGAFAGSVTIQSNTPGGDFVIHLTGEGRRPPAVDVSADAVTAQLFKGQSTTSIVTLSNPGGVDLEYTAGIAPIVGQGPPQEIVVFLDDIEQGAGGWTSEVYAGSDLWHRTRQRAYSPERSWACNIESQGDYASAEVVSTAVVSPPVDLRGVDPPMALRFFERYETEPAWDQCMVDISSDGGATWTPLRGAYGSAPSGSSDGWVLERFSLSNHAGRIVRFRFYFETSDPTNNAFSGWFVDDVAVTAATSPWVAVAPIAGVLGPGQSQDIQVHLDAGPRRPAVAYSAVIEIVSNDPFRPHVQVAATLEIRDPPRIAFPGDLVTLHSSRDYSTEGRTSHVFSVDAPPAGPGTVSLAVDGDYGNELKTATATAEAIVLGRSGGGPDGCGRGVTDYPLSAIQLEDLAADGQISVEVRNSPQVAADCAVTAHAVTLAFPSARDGLSFGDVFVRGTGSVPLTIANNGGTALIVEALSVDHDEIVLTGAPGSLPAEGSATVWLNWTPTVTGPLQATLNAVSSDPFRPAVSLTLTGQALPSAEAQVSADPFVAALPPHSDITKTRSLRLGNTGQAALNWSAPPHLFAEIQPAAGVVAPGSFVDLSVRLGSSDLASGDYAAPLVLDTDDPLGQRIEIPLTLHVGEVQPERFEIDFSPHFATVPDTVEVSLQLPAGLDPADVLIESIALFDQLEPLPGQVAFHDLDLDGVVELIVQFDLAAFGDAMPRDADPQTPVVITGEVEDRTWFRGLTWPRGVFPVDP